MGPFSTSFSRALNFCHAAPGLKYLNRLQKPLRISGDEFSIVRGLEAC